MKNIVRFAVSIVLIFTFFSSALPCGPSYISPIFDYEHAPENPYANFAAGKIGIIKPAQRRIALLAAYRYLNGGGFSEAEQKALVEVWEAELDNKPYKEDKEASDTLKIPVLRQGPEDGANDGSIEALRRRLPLF